VAGEVRGRARATSSRGSDRTLVDFEHHDFGLKAIPDDLEYVSPEEMWLRGQRARLQKPSTIESPQAGTHHRRVGG
jgi:hypothetical protein